MNHTTSKIFVCQELFFCFDLSRVQLCFIALSAGQKSWFFVLGIGGALGFIVDGIDWEHTAISSIIDSQIEVVYVFAVFAYLISTTFNLISIKVAGFITK